MKLQALIEKLALKGWHFTGDEQDLTFVNAAVEDEEKTIELINGKWRIRHWRKVENYEIHQSRADVL